MRVGIVEDSIDIAFYYRATLEAEGHEVACVFDNGQQAIEADWSNVDVAVVDYAMPGEVHGGQVLEHLKEEHPHVKRVLATAFPVHGLDFESVQSFADVVLQKPFAIQVLVDRLSLLRGSSE